MDFDLVKSNWALLVALAIALMLAPILMQQAIKRSAWGQLRSTLQELAKASREEVRARRAAAQAERQLDKLLEHADRTKPRRLQEVRDALEDARALAKIAGDKMLVAQNHVRRVIVEEYPPGKQDRLRQKYLPEPSRDKRPFSF